MEGKYPWFLKGLLALVFLILLARLTELQVIKGEYYQNLANDNRIKRVTLPAPRGKIIARGGEILVDEKDGQTIYNLSDQAAHLTGYVSEANVDEVGKVDPNCPDKGPRYPKNLVGRTGLEEEYDCLLRGINGENLEEVNSKGEIIRNLGKKEPVPGIDLHVTIDYSLQKKVAMSFPQGKAGAVVVTNGLGQILSFYSAPSFNPEKVNEVVNDASLPLFNRALDGLYHPGSTFKIITSTAALEEGKIDGNFTYTDTGAVTVNGFTYSNWFFTQYGRTEGNIDLTKAIARSTDTFFYKVGELVGIDDLSKWAQKFNLDKKTGVDLPVEAAGIIPDPKWKRATKGELWFLGDTFNVSIGQGDVAITPVAANMLASVIANGGKVCTPYINQTSSSKCNDLHLKDSTINLIKEGMIGACSTGGTAFPFFDFKPQVACKTGTAETSEKDKTHAWFAAFAPADNPQIVIDVLVEKGGEGSQVAAPIAKDILTYYFGRK